MDIAFLLWVVLFLYVLYKYWQKTDQCTINAVRMEVKMQIFDNNSNKNKP